MFDMDALKARAAVRLNAANVANVAKRLIQEPPISQLATLASSEANRAGSFRLVNAINRCCNARGDDDANRVALIAECSALTAPEQADMMEHFNAEAQTAGTVADEFEVQADKLADLLVLRDRQLDDRRMCLQCRSYRPGRCGNHRVARLHSPEVGRDLAALLQRCLGYEPALQKIESMKAIK